MTQYHGGKKRIGKRIAQLIYDVSSEYDGIKGYCEPFCGMCGVYQHIPALFQDQKMTYKAGDVNQSVIMMWKEAQRGWIPPTSCSERTFLKLKGDGVSSAEKGFLGHAAGFRSIYFATYREGANIKYQSEQTQEFALTLKDVLFTPGEYMQFSRLKNYIIYCDPPYTTSSNYPNEYHQYSTFDHDIFYKWVDKMSVNNLVFISERTSLPYKQIGAFNGNEKLYFV